MSCCLAACGGADDAPRPAGPLVAAGPVEQSRYDADRHLFVLPVRNTSSRPVTLTGVQLDTPAYARVPVEQRDDPLPGGQRVDLRLQYGAARCTGAPRRTAALLTVRVGGAAPVTQRLVAPAPSGALERAHAAECAQQQLQDAFAVELLATGPARVVDGLPSLPGLLRVTRRASRDALTVAELRGSLLFDLTPAGAGPVLHLDARQRSAERALELSVTTCDPHLLIEANAVHAFQLTLQVGDDPAPRAVRLDASPALQARLGGLAPLCAPAPPG